MRQIDDTSIEHQETKHVTSTREGVRIGNLVVLAQPTQDALNQYKRQLLAKSYQISETEHFTICQHPSTNKLILMHLFWGAWCIEAIKGEGRYTCEELMGGMLIIERSREEKTPLIFIYAIKRPDSQYS